MVTLWLFHWHAFLRDVRLLAGDRVHELEQGVRGRGLQDVSIIALRSLLLRGDFSVRCQLLVVCLVANLGLTLKEHIFATKARSVVITVEAESLGAKGCLRWLLAHLDEGTVHVVRTIEHLLTSVG